MQNENVANFIKYQCELMPPGTVPIYETKPTGRQIYGCDEFEDILVSYGPENWITYRIDCYQLYLFFCSWKSVRRNNKLGPEMFAREMVKTEGVCIVDNYRYAKLAKEMPEWTQALNGKMFLGIRHRKYRAEIDELEFYRFR